MVQTASSFIRSSFSTHTATVNGAVTPSVRPPCPWLMARRCRVDILLWDMLDVNLHESVGGRELLSEYPLVRFVSSVFHFHRFVSPFIDTFM